MRIKAPIKIDRKTKNLAKRLSVGDIAVINHKDIDEIAATSLVEAKIKAVINADISISGRYPNKGPQILCEKNIFILDNVGKEVFDTLKEGDVVEIIDDKIYLENNLIGSGEILDREKIKEKLKICHENLSNELDNFIDNTIEYAKKEKDFILGNLNMPFIQTEFKNKHALIVVRGQNYKEDLSTIISYIEEVKPILIGVDGGADALLEFGYTPDMIVGDMDSVSDKCLKQCKEIIVHAYPDGRAPGLERVKKLGLKATVFPAPGTSEDIAMLIPYEKGAKLIVALGTHSNMIDFLEKGRKGMASTFLVRLKIGSKLIDAKGVSLLYKSRLKVKYIWGLVVAALVPILIVAYVSTPIQQLIKLMELRMRLLLEF
ncbi:Uncharacterized membrane-anchored protein [Alkalithermobacter thermoalcaliphilus JW-YL-7 = DSM 7308]|uniref:Thiamine pyrophosphokinase domain-containing protein n=1 Tax=Alkalithermobacter thermoalcaliphilus JW-YL-7 = DSM 7308 TaxID=1121328 RepID=A0A150FPX2_CLOPD|nr:Thiamine pyrophosphokinase domain-containing protein [[Clostridium] paradoxum JW-YL-7 = DSM 7308]SHK65824.1 Uncharacterized membrane-anchored protein [[Clostridium] paradoxum JW-YL-7 = DSM 7308]